MGWPNCSCGMTAGCELCNPTIRIIHSDPRCIICRGTEYLMQIPYGSRDGEHICGTCLDLAISRYITARIIYITPET